MSTGWVYHELYMWHDTGRATTASPNRKWMQAWEHYENPETKRRFRNLVEVAGLFDDLVALQPRMATEDEILRFHTPAYVESIRAMSDVSGGNAGELTPFGPGSFEIALLAAGGTITAIDAVLEGRASTTATAPRRPSTATLRSSPSPSIRIGCTRATPAPSTNAAKGPAPASTSTFRCRRAQVMAPTSPPSSESSFRRSARFGRS